MVRDNRLPDQTFDPGEMLYHRVTKQTAQISDGKLRVQFRVERDSVNRSKYGGQPHDVLLVNHPQYEQWGVVSFPVGDLPIPLARQDADTIFYCVEHDPDNCNYQHCEIRLRRGSATGELVNNVKNSMKTWFREELNSRLSLSNLIREPEI